MKRLLIGLAALLAASDVQAKEVVVAGAGGVLGQVIKELFETPFTAATGITVRPIASDDSLARVKAQNAAGNIEWDLTEVNPEVYPVMVANKWIQALDWNRLDPERKQPDIARAAAYGVPGAVYSTVLAIRTDKQPPGKTLQSWADFWDVKTFPGPRALQDSPVRNLEFALIADGVPAAEVYKVLTAPGGVERAYRKLDQIKPHVTTWWKGSAQPTQLLSSGEVYYATTFNGRATALAEQKLPVAIMWNGASLNVQFYSVLTGAKNVDAAYEYLKFTYLDPERDAAFTARIKYPNLDPRTLSFLPADLGRTLPTHPDNLAVQFKFEPEWWAENLEAQRARWQTWLLQ